MIVSVHQVLMRWCRDTSVAPALWVARGADAAAPELLDSPESQLEMSCDLIRADDVAVKDVSLLLPERMSAPERLRALAARLQIEEIVINTWTFDPEARRRSYALLAEVFGLVGAPP